ncbi:MAG TPA: DUF5685 family protein [Pyrinomonadaceae bacterium]
MRVKKCGMSDAEKNFRRLHYCGTCKTIGSLYGQKSRFLLNHDTVFLAELLTSLNDENVRDWQSAYQSYNCLSLPKNEMPLPLEFAATANLILAEFKLADKITDENSRAGKIARKTFSNSFQKAQRKLEEWKFPFETVRKILSAQETIETASRQSNKTPGEILNELSRPTAEATAIFFGEGARLTGKSRLENSAAEIGFRFGKLIYLLDAFEDYEKDFRRKQFNAIRAAFRQDEEKIPAEIKRKIISILQKLESEITAEIYKLPIAENQKTLFVSRLKQNLQRKLKTSLPVLKTKKACPPGRKQSFSERWQNAARAARKMAGGFSWQMPLVFIFVFAFALVAPAQTKDAKSARECFDLSFNLMFLGAIFGSVLAFPKTILMENPEELLTKEGRKKKLRKGSSGDSGGGEGWCDSCECCCCDCGGEGSSSCCEGCNCCSGCCDNCGCDGCCDCSCD